MRLVRYAVLGLAALLVAFFVIAIVPHGTARDPRAEAAEAITARMAPVADPRARATIQSRVLIGQAVVCGADQDAALKALTLTSAMIATFTGQSSAAEEAGNYAFKVGGDLQEAGNGAPCSDVLSGFEAMRKTLRDKGLRE